MSSTPVILSKRNKKRFTIFLIVRKKLVSIYIRHTNFICVTPNLNLQ